MDATRRPSTFQLSPDEAHFVEACLARRRELMTLANTAPVGHVLQQCEDATVLIAQKIGSELLTDALKLRVSALEEKKGSREPVNVGQPGGVGGRTTAPSSRPSVPPR